MAGGAHLLLPLIHPLPREGAGEKLQSPKQAAQETRAPKLLPAPAAKMRRDQFLAEIKTITPRKKLLSCAKKQAALRCWFILQMLPTAKAVPG